MVGAAAVLMQGNGMQGSGQMQGSGAMHGSGGMYGGGAMGGMHQSGSAQGSRAHSGMPAHSGMQSNMLSSAGGGAGLRGARPGEGGGAAARAVPVMAVPVGVVGEDAGGEVGGLDARRKLDRDKKRRKRGRIGGLYKTLDSCL